MKRKHYERPSLEVVVLKQTGMLMTSGNEVLRTDYGDVIEETWGGSSAPLLNDDVLFE